jgi:Cys-tRNA synthase (O-phospho-L-seryl-tRNA:Cys-tRNA synthase)
MGWVKYIYNGHLRKYYVKTGHNPLTNHKPVNYFQKLLSYCSRKMNTFCLRCGCKVGANHIEQELVEYDGYHFCQYCVDNLKEGVINTPDIKDLDEDEKNWLRGVTTKIKHNLH